MSAPRVFFLDRKQDATGTSGTGNVAWGVQFPDGVCVIRWNTAVTSTAVYDSIADVESLHGHGGLTRVEFVSSHAARDAVADAA